jgi:hypothetical protein
VQARQARRLPFLVHAMYHVNDLRPREQASHNNVLIDDPIVTNMAKVHDSSIDR